jgi:hypothetical protein
MLLGKVENERTWRLFREARSIERLRASMTRHPRSPDKSLIAVFLFTRTA